MSTFSPVWDWGQIYSSSRRKPVIICKRLSSSPVYNWGCMFISIVLLEGKPHLRLEKKLIFQQDNEAKHTASVIDWGKGWSFADYNRFSPKIAVYLTPFKSHQIGPSSMFQPKKSVTITWHCSHSVLWWLRFSQDDIQCQVPAIRSVLRQKPPKSSILVSSDSSTCSHIIKPPRLAANCMSDFLLFSSFPIPWIPYF